MIDTSKATPRPWMVGASWGRTTRRVPIYPETPTLDQLIVAEARGGNPEANAALIVTAVNAYDAMREALGAALKEIRAQRGYAFTGSRIPYENDPRWIESKRVEAVIEATLKAAANG